ncbi:hypothetical protein IH824_07550, partial [candidate division KSB1 bacterium]|nr:hypothetical protein [candidate division KSB1 bacterium]
EWMTENNEFDVEINNLSDEYSLLAVQGPESKKVMQKLMRTDLDLQYYYFKEDKVAGIDVIISRTGYTGESGYEIYFEGNETIADKMWNKIFEAGKEFNIKFGSKIMRLHTTSLISGLLFIILGYLIFSGTLFAFNQYVTATSFQKYIYGIEDVLLGFLK